MNEHELIQLGMFTNELQRLQRKYGFWMQDAEVYSQNKADPIAKIGAGGGKYCVQILDYPLENIIK